MDQVGQEVKRLRDKKGWSQAKLAAAAEMSVSGVSQIENGHRNLSTATLVKLARALEVEVSDLFPKAQAPLSFEAFIDEEDRQIEAEEERRVQHFLTRCPSEEKRIYDLEKTVDILRHYYDLGYRMLSLMKEDLAFHGTALVWDSHYYQGLLPAIENDGVLAYAGFIENGKRDTVSQREVAACDKLIHYSIELLNLIVDMRTVHDENNTRVSTDVGRGMQEMSEYLEGNRKDVAQRGS